MKVKLYHAHSFYESGWDRSDDLVDFGPSKTQQSGKDDADINVIVGRFLKSGTLPQVQLPPMYGDFSNIMDLEGAMNVVAAASQSFMALPPEVRSKFENDPVKFVAFCEDSDNLPAMRKMGLAIPEPEVPVVSEEVPK